MGGRPSCLKVDEIDQPTFEPSFDSILKYLSDNDLEYQTRNQKLTPTSKIERCGRKVILVFETIRNNRMKLFKCLVERFDWDINTEVDGDTILTYSIRYGSIEKFRYILDLQGINVHHTTSHRHNPVLLSLTMGKEDYFRILVERGVIPSEVMDLPSGNWSQESLKVAYQLVFVRFRSYLIFVKSYSNTAIGKIPIALIREIASFI